MSGFCTTYIKPKFQLIPESLHSGLNFCAKLRLEPSCYDITMFIVGFMFFFPIPKCLLKLLKSMVQIGRSLKFNVYSNRNTAFTDLKVGIENKVASSFLLKYPASVYIDFPHLSMVWIVDAE